MRDRIDIGENFKREEIVDKVRNRTVDEEFENFIRIEMLFVCCCYSLKRLIIEIKKFLNDVNREIEAKRDKSDVKKRDKRR